MKVEMIAGVTAMPTVAVLNTMLAVLDVYCFIKDDGYHSREKRGESASNS
jgi:hypothetical protein